MLSSGCSLHPDCLTCPYPDCAIPVTAGRPPGRWHRRALEARQLAAAGMHPLEIAARLGCSRRSVYRYLDAEVDHVHP